MSAEDDRERRKGGRPRLDAPGARVTTWVHSPEYERLLRLAKTHDKSLSGVVRDLLRLRLTDKV